MTNKPSSELGKSLFWAGVIQSVNEYWAREVISAVDVADGKRRYTREIVEIRIKDIADVVAESWGKVLFPPWRQQ